jgi:Fe2+ or Zn2+ uptake regulation protein
MGQGGGLLLERLCRQAGATMRITGARRSLLCCMASKPKYAWSADELLDACNCVEAGAISRSGDYRTLEQLVAAEIVNTSEIPLHSRRTNEAATHQRYTLRPEVLGEIALSDAEQPRTIQIPATPELRRALASLCRRHRFAIDELSIEVRGRFK